MKKTYSYLFALLLVCTVAFNAMAQKAATPKAPDKPIILKGAPMGGVKFEHSKHAVDCATCHHAPKEPVKGKEQFAACTTCHTKPAQAGMKTTKQTAFHNATGQAGLCIDCHKKEAAAKPAAPVKCAQCHKKDNV